MVDGIYNAILGSAISLTVILIYLGIIEDVGDMIKHKNPGPIIWSFIKVMFAAGILIGGKYLMVLIFSIGKEFIDKIVLQNGVNVFSASTWVTVPDKVVNATNGLSTTSGILFWVVTLIAALVIMVVCFSIMLTVYGRLFKIYMHIAIAPIPLACFASRSTMQHFLAFIKSFVGVMLEGIVIIVACMIFSAFANGFDINNQIEGVVTEQAEMEIPAGYTEEDVQNIMESENCTWEEAIEKLYMLDEAVHNPFEKEPSDEVKAENAELVWKYLGEMLFLFVLLAAVIKGADDYVRKLIGV